MYEIWIQYTNVFKRYCLETIFQTEIKGHNSHNNWLILSIIKLDLYFMIIYICMKYESNTPKYSKDIALKQFFVCTRRTYGQGWYYMPPYKKWQGIIKTTVLLAVYLFTRCLLWMKTFFQPIDSCVVSKVEFWSALSFLFFFFFFFGVSPSSAKKRDLLKPLNNLLPLHLLTTWVKVQNFQNPEL